MKAKETTYLQHTGNKNLLRIIINKESRTVNIKRRIYTRKTRKLTKTEINFMKVNGNYKELTFKQIIKKLEKIRLTWLIPVMKTKQMNVFEVQTMLNF